MMIVICVVGTLIAVVALAYIVGMMMPQNKRTVRMVHINQAPETLFAVLNDPPSAATWRTGLKSTEMLPDRNGHRMWKEFNKMGTMTFIETEVAAPTRLVVTIADKSAGFGGAWTFSLKPSSGGTDLTIADDAEVYSPMYRVMGALFFNSAQPLEQCLRDLAKKYGETVAPQPVQ